jgi:hypothetical protein
LEERLTHIEARVGPLVQQLACKVSVGEDCGVVFQQGVNVAIKLAQGHEQIMEDRLVERL